MNTGLLYLTSFEEFTIVIAITNLYMVGISSSQEVVCIPTAGEAQTALEGLWSNQLDDSDRSAGLVKKAINQTRT